LSKGLVQVYTGDGKGKTTAAWGQALRAAGHGLRVCLVMLLKGDADLGEVRAAARLAPEIVVRQFGASREELARRMRGEAPGRSGSWWQAGYTDDDRRRARQGLAFARAAMASGEFDMVVLDEANVAMSAGLLEVGEVLAALRERPAHVEVILTGRNAPEQIIAAADLVTEMRSIKHRFDTGLPARRGIEY
jgi:cob(I)alamin adenosyltransferase